MSLVSGWRLALRLAWRDVRRSRARSALVLVMVTFPVIAVAAADVLQATSSVSSVEGLDRRLGTAEAQVQALPDTKAVYQLADPDNGGLATTGRRGVQATLPQIETALGGGSRPATEVRERQVGVHTEAGVLQVNASGLDLRSPLTQGMYRLTSGRLPSSAGEVDVNGALAGLGFSVGDPITLTDGTHLRIVGTAESATLRTSPILVGPLASMTAGPHAVRSWLVGGAPITWGQVQAANAVGATVLSRQVIEHPPRASQLPAQFRGYTTDNSQLYAVLALIGVMALMEVVLLAGPAFAVGARRQSRALALLAANGGTPAEARRVVLGSAVVLGTIGALGGTAIGIGLARVLLPVLQGMQDTYFGPFQIRWLHLMGIAGFGLLSAFLAAVVPAWIASRQDVVAVLAGRRGDRAASRRSPFIGLVLLAAGVVGAALGSRRSSGEFMIAGAAVVSVLGMIFLVPVVVLGVARLGRRMPLPLRYAVRDAARHRTRTVPAVAAVAATVAGVVALSIANSSDQEQAKAEYQPSLATGVATVAAYQRSPDWQAIEAAVQRVAPRSRPQLVEGVTRVAAVRISIPGHSAEMAGYAGSFALPLAVDSGPSHAAETLAGGLLSAADRSRMEAGLREGRAVIFTDGTPTGDRVRLTVRAGAARHTELVPATYIDLGTDPSNAEGVLPSSLAIRLGVHRQVAGIVMPGSVLTPSQESTLRQTLTGMDPTTSLYVERGYQVPGNERVVLWILFGLGAVLMLGGTLTATFLALSDARPDLATLSAVGASPRTRRAVAAAYAVAVGMVGSVLGAAVGFIPGIAVSYPLTRGYFGSKGPSHYLDIPWTLIAALVVALPLLTAAVVGLVARSRLPVVARLD